MKQKKFKLFRKHGPSAKMEEFKLVSGIFNPAEGADVLLSLINYKIKYHSVRLLSLKTDQKADIQNSENRITELKQTKARITELLIAAKDNGTLLEISSSICVKNSVVEN